MRPRALAAVAMLLAGCHPRPQTYAAACSMPPSGWLTSLETIPPSRGVVVVRLTRDALRWNGTPLSRAAFRDSLSTAGDLMPQPVVALAVAADVDCDAVAEVRNAMRAAPLCAVDHSCGEGPGFVARPPNIE